MHYSTVQCIEKANRMFIEHYSMLHKQNHNNAICEKKVKRSFRLPIEYNK